MNDLNTATISGVLADPPKIHRGDGFTVANFTIKVGGEYKGKTYSNYIKCKTWNDNVRAIESAEEGSRVFATGNLKSDSYEKDGRKVWQTILDAKQVVTANGAANIRQPMEHIGPGGLRVDAPPAHANINPDDIPF